MPYGPSLSYPSTCHVSFGPWLKYVLRRSRCCCLSATPTGSICRSISLTVMCDTRKWCFCTSSRHIVRYPPSLPVHNTVPRCFMIIFFCHIFHSTGECNADTEQNAMSCHVQVSIYTMQYCFGLCVFIRKLTGCGLQLLCNACLLEQSSLQTKAFLFY